MTRTIVKICPHPDGLVALAADGTLWLIKGTEGWVQLPALPQAEPRQPVARGPRPKFAVMEGLPTDH